MKTVFSNSEVLHKFANQHGDYATNSGHSLFFEKTRLYSYGHHFEMAQHVRNEAGEKAVLITQRRYSNTTAKQQSYLWSAVRHLHTIDVYSSDYSHQENFTQWLFEAKQIASNLTTAKKPEIYLSQLARLSSVVDKYATFFSLAVPIELQTALSISNKDEYKAFAAKEIEYKKEQDKKNAIALKKKHKEQMKKWLKGEISRLSVHDGYDYLRYNDTEKRVETTQAVHIPLDSAFKLWQYLKANGMLTVGCSFMRFTISQSDKKITKIGCHTFKTQELIKFGDKHFTPNN